MHTHSSEHTPGAVGSHVAAPGEHLEDRCLAQGSHLSRGIEGGESTCYSLPPSLLLLGEKKRSINISDCFVLVAYKNLSFNNGFNIFYSITLLTVFIYNICCFASVKMNRDISLKLCFCHLHQLYLYKIH